MRGKETGKGKKMEKVGKEGVGNENGSVRGKG